MEEEYKEHLKYFLLRIGLRKGGEIDTERNKKKKTREFVKARKIGSYWLKWASSEVKVLNVNLFNDRLKDEVLQTFNFTLDLALWF